MAMTLGSPHKCFVLSCTFRLKLAENKRQVHRTEVTQVYTKKVQLLLQIRL